MRKYPGIIAVFLLAILSFSSCSIITGPELTGSKLAALRDKLDEDGFCTVTTLDNAEALAGFKIVVPSFIPDGFYRQERINISQLGGGLPEDFRPPDGPITVERFYETKTGEDAL